MSVICVSSFEDTSRDLMVSLDRGQARVSEVISYTLFGGKVRDGKMCSCASDKHSQKTQQLSFTENAHL